ncbi:MAG TPA: hypothetical protein P5234_04940 [Thermoanaerobaculaceae bacterium]|nr:hypothetical protein [Thermoanaerobaculaceae bacterium]HRS15579.1 hypothetical protein [Thermoanaerobaculaceae bacterium]
MASRRDHPCPVCGQVLEWDQEGERFCCRGPARHAFICEGWGDERVLVLVGAVADPTVEALSRWAWPE